MAGKPSAEAPFGARGLRVALDGVHGPMRAPCLFLALLSTVGAGRAGRSQSPGAIGLASVWTSELGGRNRRAPVVLEGACERAPGVDGGVVVELDGDTFVFCRARHN